MRFRAAPVLVVTAGALTAAYYSIEPWAATFADDGPYYSVEYSGRIDELPLCSQVELRRFGRLVYTLESRLLAEADESVLVLRDAYGTVEWARLPVKPDGELGAVDVRRASATWYGGWRISIKPDNQEGGHLYLSGFGGFRFFNHSW